MYKRTIWQDHVEGLQEGTDMSAANFNNLEAGTMEAMALAAMNTSYRRYTDDLAKNGEVTRVTTVTITGASATQYIAIPENLIRNTTDYHLAFELIHVQDGNAGDLWASNKQANGFYVKYTGTASYIVVQIWISGGMI